MAYVLKDSGEREKHESGAVRDVRTKKGRYELLSPIAIFEITRIYEDGAIKYEPRNWEKGMPLSRYIDSALRHTFQLLEGKQDENHAAQACWNLMAFMHTREMINRGVLPKELDDMPTYLKED